MFNSKVKGQLQLEENCAKIL